MSAYNPYAPPAPAPAASFAPPHGAHSADVEEALRALNAHLAIPSNVAADAKLARRFINKQLIGLLVLVALLSFLPFALGIRNGLLVVGLPLFAIALVVAMIFFRLPPRKRHVTPNIAIRAFLGALRFAYDGMALACLAPTARLRTVYAPQIPGLPSAEGTFAIDTVKGMRDYAKTFCRAGQGQTRVLTVRRVTVLEVRGDVADVDVEAIFMTIPTWANIGSILAFLVLRVIGLVLGAVLYFALRKRARVAFAKRLIRGSDGLWYVLDANMFEQPPRLL